jgi:hypothetical protein
VDSGNKVLEFYSLFYDWVFGKVTPVRSQGFNNIKFNVFTKDIRKLGYLTNVNDQVNSNTSSQINDLNAEKLMSMTQTLIGQAIDTARM